VLIHDFRKSSLCLLVSGPLRICSQNTWALKEYNLNYCFKNLSYPRIIVAWIGKVLTSSSWKTKCFLRAEGITSNAWKIGSFHCVYRTWNTLDGVLIATQETAFGSIVVCMSVEKYLLTIVPVNVSFSFFQVTWPLASLWRPFRYDHVYDHP